MQAKVRVLCAVWSGEGHWTLIGETLSGMASARRVRVADADMRHLGVLPMRQESADVYQLFDVWAKRCGGDLLDDAPLATLGWGALLPTRVDQWNRTLYITLAGASGITVSLAVHFSSLTNLSQAQKRLIGGGPRPLTEWVRMLGLTHGGVIDASVGETTLASFFKDATLLDVEGFESSASAGETVPRAHMLRLRRRGLSIDLPFAGELKGAAPSIQSFLSWKHALKAYEDAGLVFAGAWQALPTMPMPVPENLTWTVGPLSGGKTDGGMLQVSVPMMSPKASFTGRFIGRDPDGFRLALQKISEQGVPRISHSEFATMLSMYGMALRANTPITAPAFAFSPAANAAAASTKALGDAIAAMGPAIAAMGPAIASSLKASVGPAFLASGGVAMTGGMLPKKVETPVARRIAHLSADEMEALEAFRRSKRSAGGAARESSAPVLTAAGERMIDLGEDES